MYLLSISISYDYRVSYEYALVFFISPLIKNANSIKLLLLFTRASAPHKIVN